MKKRFKKEDINQIKIEIKFGDIIFLNWDLAAWKTTLSKHIINNILRINEDITSPTYTYYNRYWSIFHFDLYRLENYDEFYNIWGEDIVDNAENICLIEWPDIISKYFEPTIIINLEKTDKDDERIIEIIYK
jgi:tRNA threonylcarbamoyladenosine biosynthesis protein TsaE